MDRKMMKEFRLRVSGKTDALRFIASKLKQHVSMNSSFDFNSSIYSTTNLSSFEGTLFSKLEEFRQRREIYLNGTVEIGSHFARTYIVLGAVALLLNLTILMILLIHRRHVFRHVFYLLIFNFAIIDTLKGVCLIAYALRMIKTPSSSISSQIAAFKFDQYMTLIFRFCNLATILNLLMITLNEFVFIKFPLRYHQLINRRLALILIGFNWVVCIVFTVVSTFAKGTGGRVFVSSNYTNDPNMTAMFNRTIMRKTAADGGGMDIHYVFAFTLTAFCLSCMIVVLVCYTIFFLVIREIRHYDNRLYQDANRRPSEVSTNSCEITSALDDRRIKRQLLKRYKYALVIGFVILACMLYLLSYSTIQIFQYLHLSWEKPFTSDPVEHRKSYLVRWVLQILVGLHSVVQPLCYFRMKEFRHFVKRILCYPCQKEKRERDFLTSFVETPQQQKITAGNGNGNGGGSIIVKSTSFRNHIYYIFRKKNKQQQPLKRQQTIQATLVTASTNNNKNNHRNYHERTKNNSLDDDDQDDLAKELTTLMQNNSGTEL